MNLPTLPPSFPAGYIAQTEHFYTAEQMKAYGQQCREAALEESAIDAERFGHLWSGAPAGSFFDLAEKLRSMK